MRTAASACLRLTVWATIGVAFALCLPARAKAHEWYDPKCCSSKDCREIDPALMVRNADDTGWIYSPTGEVVLDEETRLTPFNRAGNTWHICTIAGHPEARIISPYGERKCLYVPDAGG